MGKQKFYVVWKGRKRGIFSSWEECSASVKGYVDAQYMAFPSRELAEQAFRGRYADYRDGHARAAKLSRSGGDGPAPDSIAVDAACSGNPGPMEYRGVHIGAGREIFRQGPLKTGTNNIGEFLAIVHALAYLKNEKLDWPIYSDSVQAIRWVQGKQCKTKLPNTEESRAVFTLIARAQDWLRENSFANDIRKWKTEKWGESPADFGRK
ncbi:MAG: ribonuclease H family protein [Anaerolineales bacterium]|nr:ribonuclease H family protein [Anaerolineales bacterium]